MMNSRSEDIYGATVFTGKLKLRVEKAVMTVLLQPACFRFEVVGLGKHYCDWRKVVPLESSREHSLREICCLSKQETAKTLP